VAASPASPSSSAFPVPSGSSRKSGRLGEGIAARTFLFLTLSALAGVIVAGLLLPAVGLAGLTAKRGAENFQALPAALKVPPLKQRSRLLAADGTTIATFYSQNRVYVPLAKISQEMQDAIVAIEDQRFYEHNGIDVRGTVRAVLANSQAGGVTQGGSTLTQQYVKNVLQSTAQNKADREAAAEDSVSRKIRELRYALGLEERWTKERILEGYLNIAYFGSQAYGVEVAAQRYFSKPASKLNAGEAATIAGIVKYPTLYDPLENTAKAGARRNVVLQRMVEQGMISQTEADEFKSKSLRASLNPSDLTRGCAVSKFPFFCAYVQESFLLDPAYGKSVADRRALLNGGGLTIRTTLNIGDQRAAQAAVENYIPTGDPSGRVAAIAMVEPGSGNVNAMAQNLDYGEGNGKSYINNAVDAKYSGTNGQQAGSTFKIFTAAAAIENGFPMDEVIYSPATKTFPYGANENCDGYPLAEWKMENYDGGAPGNYDMRSGMASSVNTYFAELERRIGVCEVVDIASRAGIHWAANGVAPIDDPDLQTNSFTLGDLSVSPLNLAEAYATFAARGLHCEPRAIVSIKTIDDEAIPVPRPDCEQTIEPEVADAVTSLLQGVLQPGATGETMVLDRPAGGKTGTASEFFAVWFAGYTPDLAAAVWAGHPKAPATYPMRDVTINGTYYSSVYGRSIPGPIWQEAMLGALVDVPPTSFVTMNPDLVNGLTITVPSLVGLTEKQAISRLRSAGLRATVGDYQVASYQDEGTVSYSSPGAGTGVPPRTMVTFYLSNGTPPPPEPSPSSEDENSPSPTESGGNGNANPPGNGNGNGGGGGGNPGGNGGGNPGGGGN